MIENSMKLRDELADILIQWHKSSGNSQMKTGELLNLSQPRMSNLINKRLEKFSLEALVEYLSRAGFTVTISATHNVVVSDGETEEELVTEEVE